MNKNSKLAAGLFGVAFFFGTAAYATETSTVGNLTETSDKISSIDMNKNLGEAGNVFSAFYSGSKAKGDSSSQPVYVETKGSQRTLAQAEKELCNAKASKIKNLSSKVPPLNSQSSNDSGRESIPVGALAVGSIVLALAGSRKSFLDSAATVFHAAQHPVDTYNDINNMENNTHSYETHSGGHNSSNQVNSSSSTSNSSNYSGDASSGDIHMDFPSYSSSSYNNSGSAETPHGNNSFALP